MKAIDGMNKSPENRFPAEKFLNAKQPILVLMESVSKACKFAFPRYRFGKIS